MAIIYGVDTAKRVSPRDVRDAIVECFVQAHKEQLEELGSYDEDSSSIGLEEIKRINVRQLLRNLFEQNGDDFDNPTKEALVGAVEGLKVFAASFRNQEIIQRHYKEIADLIALL